MSFPSELANFQRTVEYLIEHAEATPFDLQEVAHKVEISGDVLQRHFKLLARVFKLRELLEENTGKPAGQAIPSEGEKISLTPDQLKLFSDFAHLSRSRPIRLKSFAPQLYDLHAECPLLFEEVPGGWQASPAGEYFAEQYVSFRRLKMNPGELVFESLELELI